MKLLWNALGLFLLLSLLTGLAYPLAMTGVLQLLFPNQANGSLLVKNHEIYGSNLLAQKFARPDYFWPRPSASDFSALPSGASNLGPTSEALKKAVHDRRAALQRAHGLPASTSVPADLIFTSASGLDPHLSPEAVRFQLTRVAQARRWTPTQIQTCRALIARLTEPPQFGLLGQPRINVLLLNAELDKLK